MLFLLRNIRRKLLTGNQITTYLLYGIGEIFLVVIGILIAVSIDNWNEDRKQKIVEKKYFQNLRNDLLTDDKRLTEMLEYSANKVSASSRVMRSIKQDSVSSLYQFTSDMQTLIFVDEFNPDQSTYNEMKSSGNLSTLQNEELKLKLIGLQSLYIEIQGMQAHVRNDFNVFLENFELYVDWSRYYNLEKSDITHQILAFDSTYIESHTLELHQEIRALFRNKVFANNIFLLEINHGYWIERLTSTQSKVRELIALIDEEIQT